MGPQLLAERPLRGGGRCPASTVLVLKIAIALLEVGNNRRVLAQLAVQHRALDQRGRDLQEWSSP